jgi:hypothetical protein
MWCWNGAENVRLLLALAVVAGGIVLLGCAADRPTSSAPTQKEVRGNSDRFFDKMKQEEREQGTSSVAPAR